MRSLINFIQKELLLLWRDKVGLLILFVLPMCLVFFISLTSPNKRGDQHLNMLLINQDKGQLGNAISDGLKKISLFKITEDDKKYTVDTAKTAVAQGDYQAVIIVPNNLSKNVDRISAHNIKRGKTNHKDNQVMVYIDPAVPESLKNDVLLTLQALTSNIEREVMSGMLTQALRLPKNKLDTPMLSVKATYVSASADATPPNSIQQNVPAWSLFGMFFIVIPLAAEMVREREQGVMQRLLIGPSSKFTLLTSKILAFLCLNMIQLFLMLLVGVYILPQFGLPELQLFTHLPQVIVIGIFASLAATGFGLLIGTWAMTREQAMIVGPFLITILAAVGGIFVPTYLMPAGLQDVSGLSPMNWAQEGFIDIFVRNAHIADLTPYLAKLFIFFLAMMVLSLMRISSKSGSILIRS